MKTAPKNRIDTSKIESTVCDGKIIIGISNIIFRSKGFVTALAHIPCGTDISTVREAIDAAQKRVEYACSIELFLSPVPIYLCVNSNNYYEIASEIIKALSKDYEIQSFKAEEVENTISFEFELIVPKAEEKKNAKLLYELKKQFRKLSNKIVLSVTIIRSGD